MTSTAINPLARQNERPGSQVELEMLWRDRIEQAKQGRRLPEQTILSDLAFAAGQQWLVYDPDTRRMRHIAEMDPARYGDRELYTADRIREYRAAQLGELNADSDRPELLAVADGDQAEASAHELNLAAEHGWDREWNAEDALRQARRYVVDMGVGAIRCRWDPAAGPITGHIQTDRYGKPVTPETHPADTQALQTTGQMADGSLPQIKPVKEGRTRWEPLTALHLLPPPGVNHEKDFPYFAIARPVPLADITALYGDLATAGLTEDVDIASLAGVTTGQQAQSGQPGSANRLRGHIWVYTCFDLPSARHPEGRVTVLGSNQYRLLDQRDQLDYQLPDGSWHTGVVFLHWERHSDRFWSRSFITPMKDPQRLINRRKTQNLEIIDRGMPAHYIEEGSLPETPEGRPMEIREIAAGKPQPTLFPGAGPGPWMYEDIASLVDDLGHASTLSQLRLGENPQNVDTYAQLAQLNENEQVKRSEARAEHQAGVAKLLELSMVDALRYWPDGKWLLVSGDEDQLRRAQFQKGKLPKLFMAKVASGAPQPRSQAAELKKIDAIWAAAVQSGVAVQQATQWIAWYTESLQAGKALPLPEPDRDSQERMAELENLLMQQGDQPPVFDYDLLPVHLPKHREAMDQARAANDMPTVQRIFAHVQAHIKAAQLNAALTAQAQQQPSATVPQAGPAAFAAPDFLRLAAGNP